MAQNFCYLFFAFILCCTFLFYEGKKIRAYHDAIEYGKKINYIHSTNTDQETNNKPVTILSDTPTYFILIFPFLILHLSSLVRFDTAMFTIPINLDN